VAKPPFRGLAMRADDGSRVVRTFGGSKRGLLEMAAFDSRFSRQWSASLGRIPAVVPAVVEGIMKLPAPSSARTPSLARGKS
jgi:hypothetical protein